MISIAIVGNIASGKSTVENVLRKKGYKVFDSDIIAHEVLDDLSEKILEAFKDYDISENGRTVSCFPPIGLFQNKGNHHHGDPKQGVQNAAEPCGLQIERGGPVRAVKFPRFRYFPHQLRLQKDKNTQRKQQNPAADRPQHRRPSFFIWLLGPI